MSVLLRDVLLDGRTTDVYVEENRVAEIGRRQEADLVLDGRGKACLPGLVNAHTHAAMTLFRSYADDMALQEWLERKIWPLEEKLTEEDVYWGTKLACLEMIRTGTTTFNDMYFFMEAAARAVEEMEMRAVLSHGIIDLFDPERAERELRATERFLDFVDRLGCSRVTAALGPHAPYTVSAATLEAVRDLAVDRDLKVHFHLAETQRDLEDARERYGAAPVRALEERGLLGEWLVAAHAVWIDAKDAALLGERSVATVHNPTSNMKLAVGGAFPYKLLKEHGVTTALGTDGAASNNNLDLFEAMKLACLLQKFATGDPTRLTAAEAIRMATREGGAALGLPVGRVEEGGLADLVLVDLGRPETTPLHNLDSVLAYAANGSVVDTVLCDGQVLMAGREVPGEEEILREAGRRARGLVGA